MLREILTDKWFIGLCVVLIVVVFGGIFWSHHELAPYKKSADESAERRRQWEAAQKETDTSNKTSKTVESVNDEVVDDNTVSKNKEGINSQTADMLDNKDEDVPVSPHGFGPYPPLPSGWRGTPEGTWRNCVDPDHELLKRVAIKLISQGVNVEGGSMENGKVYPIIKGIRYVEWETDRGGRRYLVSSLGHPDDGDRLDAIRDAKFNRGEDDDLFESDIPSDIKLVDYDKGGIDPYKFLGLTPP